MCAEASTVLRAVAADFFFNCWCLEILSDNRKQNETYIQTCPRDRCTYIGRSLRGGLLRTTYRWTLWDSQQTTDHEHRNSHECFHAYMAGHTGRRGIRPFGPGSWPEGALGWGGSGLEEAPKKLNSMV
jgi:hypothetical protein